MINYDYDSIFNDLDSEDEDITEINIEEIFSKLNNLSDERLCEIIIVDRYISINKELSLACMQELSNRRLNGNNFNFEEYIEEKFKELPKFESVFPNLSSTLNELVTGLKK